MLKRDPASPIPEVAEEPEIGDAAEPAPVPVRAAARPVKATKAVGADFAHELLATKKPSRELVTLKDQGTSMSKQDVVTHLLIKALDIPAPEGWE